MVRSSGGKAWFDGRRQWPLGGRLCEALIESAARLCCRASASNARGCPDSCPNNGAYLLFRSQLYQQTGGADWAATQSDKLA